MEFDFINIITVLAVVGTVGYLIRIIIAGYTEKRKQINLKTHIEGMLTDYDKILRATHWLENEREKNQGEHFKDEAVYLNRAKNIRESSDFFSWIMNNN